MTMSCSKTNFSTSGNVGGLSMIAEDNAFVTNSLLIRVESMHIVDLPGERACLLTEICAICYDD